MEPVQTPIKDMEVSNPWATFILDGPKVTEVRKNDPENWGKTKIGDLVRVIEKGGVRTGVFRVCDLRTYGSLEDCYFGEGVRHILPGKSTRAEADDVYLGFDGPEKRPQRTTEFAKHGAIAIQLERHEVQPVKVVGRPQWRATQDLYGFAQGHPQVDTAAKPHAEVDRDALLAAVPPGSTIVYADTDSVMFHAGTKHINNQYDRPARAKGGRKDPADCPHCWDDGSSTRVDAGSGGSVGACCRCGEALLPTWGRDEKRSMTPCLHSWDDGSDAITECGAVSVCARCSKVFRSSLLSK